MTNNNNLLFDPDRHVEDTLKAFNEFIQTYRLRYDAQYHEKQHGHHSYQLYRNSTSQQRT